MDSVRARAIRIAFLIERGETAAPTLDAIFAACYGMYGGRFALLVPVVEGLISEAYWDFLEATDPDIIYSYVEIDDAVERRIHERLCPSALVLHRKPREEDRLDRRSYRPHLPVEPLTSLSTALHAARGDGIRPPTQLYLVDGWQARDVDMFTRDNFGTRTGATGNWRRHPTNDRLIRPLCSPRSPGGSAHLPRRRR
jgi:hypothetical protein